MITATTRTLIAANAKEASAYTLGRLAIRTLSDTLGGIDHVLNGPTSETWLSSWQHHLEQSGVRFFFGKELESIGFAADDRTVQSIQVSSVAAGLVRKLRRLLRSIAYDAAYRRQDKDRFRDNADTARRLMAEIKSRSDDVGLRQTLDTVSAMLTFAADRPNGTSTDFRGTPAAGIATEIEPRSARLQHPDDGDPLFASQSWVENGPIQFSALCTFVMDQLWNFEESQPDESVKGDQFVFALPVEQMAYYVNRSSTMTTLDPELANIVKLANHTDWMAGIQFYLNDTVDLGKGHFILMDSAWALTAIEERQFWSPANTNNLSPLIQSVVSIDIASWGVPGRFTRKKAYDCSDEEIATEVWSELKAGVNRREQKEVLHNGLLLAPPALHPPDPVVTSLGPGGFRRIVSGRGKIGSEDTPVDFPVMTTPRFEAASPIYSWINDLQCVGFGMVEIIKSEFRRITYDIYAIT